MLMDRLKRMSEKLKLKSRNKLSSFLSKSIISNKSSKPDKPPRRSSMPPSRGAQSNTSPIGSSSFFGANLSTPVSSSGGIGPRTLSSPSTISIPPSVRVRIPHRPSSPTGTSPQYRRNTGLSRREQRRANERRAATQESEKCRAELIRQGITVRDFQAEHDTEKRRRTMISKRKEVTSQRWELESETVSEEDEVVMRGRKHAGGRRPREGLAVAVHNLTAP